MGNEINQNDISLFKCCSFDTFLVLVFSKRLHLPEEVARITINCHFVVQIENITDKIKKKYYKQERNGITGFKC